MGVSLVFICILLAGAVVAVIFSATFFLELMMEGKRSKKGKVKEKRENKKETVTKIEPAFARPVQEVQPKGVLKEEPRREAKPAEQEEIDLDEMLAALEKRARLRTVEVEEKTEMKPAVEKKEAPILMKEPTVVKEPLVEKEQKKIEKPVIKVDTKESFEKEKPKTRVEEIDPRLNLNYEDRLSKLKETFSKLEKDYQKNTKELNKYKRTEKRKERNEKLLNKKANELTNLNLSLYNVKDIKNIDPSKKKKQEELMAHVAELKSSVADAETFLAENKVKNTQVVKLNNYLAKEYTRYMEEIKELEAFLSKNTKK